MASNRLQGLTIKLSSMTDASGLPKKATKTPVGIWIEGRYNRQRRLNRAGFPGD